MKNWIEDTLRTDSPYAKTKKGSEWESINSKNSNLTLHWKSREEVPVVRIEARFNSSFKIAKLVKCLYDPQERIKWDTSLEEIQYQDIKKNCTSYGLVYSRTKPQLKFSGRDFHEKRIAFSDENNYYGYSSSIWQTKGVTNTEEDEPPRLNASLVAIPENVVRGDVVQSLVVISRDQDNSVRFVAVS